MGKLDATAQNATAVMVDLATLGMGGDVVNGPEDLIDWDAIRWRRQEEQVQRLRQRIFKATQAGDLKQVRNPQMPTRPRGLLEPCAATSGTHGSEGAPVQQCAGATRQPAALGPRRHLRRGPLPGPHRRQPARDGHPPQHRDQPASPGRLDQPRRRPTASRQARASGRPTPAGPLKCDFAGALRAGRSRHRGPMRPCRRPLMARSDRPRRPRERAHLPVARSVWLTGAPR